MKENYNGLDGPEWEAKEDAWDKWSMSHAVGACDICDKWEEGNPVKVVIES